MFRSPSTCTPRSSTTSPGLTLVSVGTTWKALKGELGDEDKTAAAKKVGALLAKAAQAKGITGSSSTATAIATTAG